MCDSTLAIYCFIDDFLKASRHLEDVRVEVTDAEIITIALTAMRYFGGNFEESRLILDKLGLIKRLISRSRFSRRVNRLADWAKKANKQNCSLYSIENCSPNGGTTEIQDCRLFRTAEHSEFDSQSFQSHKLSFCQT